MKNPAETLGVSEQANETELRNRYLELVREFPPDRAPERFTEIRAAYDALRNPLNRISRQLFFAATTDTLAALERDMLTLLRNERLSVDALLALADSP